MKKKSLSMIITLSLVTSTVFSTTAFASTTATAPITSAPASNYGVTYQTQVQNKGWGYKDASGNWVSNKSTIVEDANVTDNYASPNEEIGTTGKSLRVEALELSLAATNGATLPSGASLQYQVQVQSEGWMAPAEDGILAGTVHKSERIEAIAVKLVGLPGYEVQYKAHVQNQGWDSNWTTGADTLGSAAGVAPSSFVGTVHKSLRIEALDLKIVKTDAEKAAEVNAINAVQTAQASKAAADVTAATTAVQAVQDTVENTTLTTEIKAINVDPQATSTSVSAITTFAQATGTNSAADDITIMNGYTFVGYQNGVGSDGKATASGVTNSTIVEYDASGNQVNSWSITGKCDGLTADTANNRLIATVNEDANSSMYVINLSAPQGQQIQHMTFTGTVDGGTDSIAVQGNNLYISASNPASPTSAALYQGTINTGNNTVTVTPEINCNSSSTNVIDGTQKPLGLTDPDSNFLVPAGIPNYAGQIVLVDQTANELVFHDTNTKNNKNLPMNYSINDIVWATSPSGTLYVTDGGSNKVYAVTENFAPGTAFVAHPGDSKAPGFVGIVDLTTGVITPIVTGLNAPKGLEFVAK